MGGVNVVNSPSRYDFIDVTRAIAAFLVVMQHVQQMVIDRPLSPGLLNKALSMVTSQGHNAVVVFFVISGFWIVRTVVRAGDEFSFKNYMLARGTRLWIVLLPALLIGAALDSIGSTFFPSDLYQGTQGSVALTYNVVDRLNFHTFFGNVLFLQDIQVPALGSNGALWTIACEFWYYVYFPLAYLAVRSRNALGIAVAGLALFILPSPHLFVCWLMGGAVYVVAERLLGDRRFPWAMPAFALMVFCGLNMISKLLALPPIANDLLLAASFAVFLTVGMRSTFGGAKPFSVLARLGSRSSYSLYATHLPIVVFICNFIVPAARMPASPYAWGVVLFVALVATFFAVAFSRLTEDQTLAVRNWVSNLIDRTTSRRVGAGR